MKKLLLVAVLLPRALYAQIANIPDTNFKTKLLSAGPSNAVAYSGGNPVVIDANANGEIEMLEAAAIDSLTVNNSMIVDLTGINAFVNLKKLNCDSNALQAINLSLPNLKRLTCQNNQYTLLDV